MGRQQAFITEALQFAFKILITTTPPPHEEITLNFD